MNVQVVVDSAHREDDGLAIVTINFEGESPRRLDLPVRDLVERFGEPLPVPLDLLILAAVCYALDKSVPRSATLDRWTREFDVFMPVSNQSIWTAAREPLERALNFLSGDVWRFTFQSMAGSCFRRPEWRSRSRPNALPRLDTVCLFSGGLDSLIGAIDLLASEQRRTVLLLGHYDMPGPKSQQDRLMPAIRKKYPWRAELHQIRVSQHPTKTAETTLRSRSFVFLAAAMYVASKLGPTVNVVAPENGLIAINVPLTPSRTGSCSTRTMHPYFLARLTEVLQTIGLQNRLETPFAFKTKGECLAECADPHLIEVLAPMSVSCSHAGRRQYWNRHQSTNCGYCVPCIFRRAALHRVGLDVGTAYGIDICTELTLDDQRDSANDLRAIGAFLAKRSSLSDIAAAIRAVATIPDIDRHAETAYRGFEEVRRLLQDKAQSRLRGHLAGIIV